MPKLLNAQYEIAAQAVAAGRAQRDAYIEAGYKYTGAGATRLFKRPEVIARIREIIGSKYEDEQRSRKVAIQKAGITEAWVIERLMYLTDVSLRGQPVLDENGVQVPGQFTGKRDGATAARCLELAAKITGIAVNRHEIGRPGDFATLTDDQLTQQVNDMAKLLGYTPAQVQKAVRSQH